jgi:hypothetical protein
MQLKGQSEPESLCSLGCEFTPLAPTTPKGFVTVALSSELTFNKRYLSS